MCSKRVRECQRKIEREEGCCFANRLWGKKYIPSVFRARGHTVFGRMTTFKWFKNHLDVVKRWRALTQRPSLLADLEFWISKPGAWSPTRPTILQFRNVALLVKLSTSWHWNNWLNFSIQSMRIAKRCNYVTKDKKEKSMYWVHFSIQFNSAHYTHQSLGSIMESLDNSVALLLNTSLR